MSTIGGGSVRPIMALALVAVLGACAETKQVAMEKPPPASAVLPEPALLAKGKGGEVDQVYLNPNVRWASYTKVMLDPVTIWTGPGSGVDTAYIYHWNLLPIGQNIALRFLETYGEFPPLQAPPSFNLEQVMAQIDAQKKSIHTAGHPSD